MFPSPRVGLYALFLLACFALVFIPQATAQSTEKPKIGFLLDSLKVERWQTDFDTFQKRARELGADVVFEEANGNDDVMLKQAKKLIDQHVKALVVVPHDTEKAVRIVEFAKSKGVPVVSYDRLIRNSDIDFFVGADAVAIGQAQASALLAVAPRGNYVLLEGSPSDINAHMVLEGQKKALKPYVERGDIKIVAELWCQDWNPLPAYTQLSDVIAKNHGQVAAVLASNDGTAGGAVQALEESKLDGKVPVSGQDADLAAVIRILKGTQTMTVYKPLASLAMEAAGAAVDLASGKQPPATASIDNGKHSVPAFFGPIVAVDRTNLKDTVIKDGFQKIDTIRASLPPEQWPK